MKIPRFSIMQMMLFMLIFCVLGAALNHVYSMRETESSPLVFLIILVSSPVLLMSLVSLIRAFAKRP